MKPETQRIAIAEACGWSQIEDRSERLMMAPGFSVVGYPPKKALIGKKEPIPDYLNDLNAMHEAEETLSPVQQQAMFGYLLAICGNKREWRATAAQRAEAFLKTIGKWEDE